MPSTLKVEYTNSRSMRNSDGEITLHAKVVDGPKAVLDRPVRMALTQDEAKVIIEGLAEYMSTFGLEQASGQRLGYRSSEERRNHAGLLLMAIGDEMRTPRK